MDRVIIPIFEQLDFFSSGASSEVGSVFEQTAPVLSDYDRFIVGFSGGKDSVAAFLYLLDQGVKPSQIELHHHLVDGREGSKLMDWPVTDAYCEAFARAFGVRYVRSWKVGGFEREMTRQDSLTAPISFEREDGSISTTGGERGNPSTRMKFPQTAADLSTRWCSAYLKVDVFSRVLTEEDRFRTGKTLVLTGERAQESASRARYKTFEPHRADLRNGRSFQRHIDHWRPVHGWKEDEVWAIMERYKINPHPAYKLGFGRTSCLTCIFGSPAQWATIRHYMPERFQAILDYEMAFGVTIARKGNINDTANRGTPYDCDLNDVALAMGNKYDASDIIVTGDWVLPLGAFGDSAGPT